MSSVEQNKKVVEQFFAAMNQGDVAGFLRLYHPQGVCWTSGSTLISGTMSLAQITHGAGAIFEAFPAGLVFTITAMTAEGDRVAVEAESKGMHVSGVVYNNLYHFLFEFCDGKVLKLKEYMDTELVTEVLCGGQHPD
ncbi:nuclear transport factor 2 family protein [Oceanicoccus sp. KOV_DT_Chl]|uniref:nuclear transport factor 2 family protein n=1 Tax=Oceanicoccus sp. KOV_DT_Chl TaxID=1904639 RepID=UPI000C7D6F8D|nr:nuclear transport factor 2 family protein [Oceanicoccus sp. KOV_DT_Chl]